MAKLGTNFVQIFVSCGYYGVLFGAMCPYSLVLLQTGADSVLRVSMTYHAAFEFIALTDLRNVTCCRRNGTLQTNRFVNSRANTRFELGKSLHSLGVSMGAPAPDSPHQVTLVRTVDKGMH
jgi:hypothetical protein